MRYCRSCIIPDTRPHIQLNAEGECNACRFSKIKAHRIDWHQREKEFSTIVNNAKKKSQGYDCVIPVSGGKDSTWQVIQCLKYKLTPLAVTWKTPVRTDIGQKNLDNLINLGVDHIDYQINPHVERKFMYESLVRQGSSAIPMHLALFNIPLKVAIAFQIPLVIWGENSAAEYGGKPADAEGILLTTRWIKKYGATHGQTAKDWIGQKLSQKDLTPYCGPSESELRKGRVKAIFLGYYFKWDPYISLRAALTHGFHVRENGPLTGYYNFADIDDHFISIHHFLKWYKFGFTRSFDNLSIEIRNKRMSRNQAIEILTRKGDETPHEDIEKFCQFAKISQELFYRVIEKFRNRKIWQKRGQTWYIKNFLIKDWNWL